jgi:hypothetical protein
MMWFSDNRDNRNPMFMVIGVAAAIISPIVAVIVQLAISRQREYLADAEEAKAVLLAPANVDCGFSIVENNELKDRIISSIKDFSGIL